MNKKRDCTHRWHDAPRCQPAFLNRDECDDCGAVWLDTWSCGCDDECPELALPERPALAVDAAYFIFSSISI
jgi:hypothetical protein